MRRQWRGSAVVPLVLLLGSSGCKESDCGGDCPKVGEAATRDDIRLVVTERSFGFIEVDGDGFDLAIGGELVLRPEEAGCVASQDQPCPVQIRRLEIRPSAFTTADRRELSDIKLALEAPLDIEDSGLGAVIDEGRTVHSCLTVDGVGEHATAPSESLTLLDLDDRGSGIQAASIEGVWPLAFFDVRDACRVRIARITITAEARLP
jgi:hypothetical protein